MLLLLTVLIATTVMAQGIKIIVAVKRGHPNLIKRDSGEPDFSWALAITQNSEGNSFVGPAISSRITRQYNFGPVFGFAMTTTREGAEQLKRDPRVSSVLRDNKVVRLQQGTQPNTNPRRRWGLDRINQVNLPLDQIYPIIGNQGEGVHVYIIDTGVDLTHPELVRPGRALTVDQSAFLKYPDFDGHGTKCAGVIAGKTLGVAPNARVVGLPVFTDSKAYDSDVLEMLEYIYHVAVPMKSVVSYSLGPDPEECGDECNNFLLRLAVRSIVERNIPVVVAAGNENHDACLLAPASDDMAFTVAHSTEIDWRSPRANHGECVDMHAPGRFIETIGLNHGYELMTGSSIAAPLVAGVFAALLSTYYYANVHALYNQVINWSLKGKLSGVPDKTPNRLLYVPFRHVNRS